MTDISVQTALKDEGTTLPDLRTMALAVIVLVAVGVLALVALRYQGMNNDAPLYANSTLGQLAVWMTDQSAQAAPPSILGGYARSLAEGRGEDGLPPDVLLDAMRNGLVIYSAVLASLGIIGLVGVMLGAGWRLAVLLVVLLGLDALLFIIPPIDSTVTLILIAILLLALALLFSQQRVSRVIGFIVILSLLLVMWQGLKGFADSIGYAVTAPLSGWEYVTYPTVEDTLDALLTGEVNAVIVDRNAVRDLVPPHPADPDSDAANFAYSDLRYLNNFQNRESVVLFPVSPNIPGRLRVVVRAEDTATWRTAQGLIPETVGTVANEFAETNYLTAPRQLILVDLKILNDINLPHLQSISSALWQPARRNGPFLLLRILLEAGLYTWGEAVVGFAMGATFGFALGTGLAHSRLMQRGLLPYVVASQTVPILAIAPMVVIWLGAGPFAVAVIASYLTFFPVTINTLRGLQSPDPMKIELMRSYAASQWTIMWKLRLPAALPYIFTALKVSATASVVGAIIGELPSSVRNGLGRAILDFSSDYSLISTPKLWGAIFIAALVGITFFLIVTIIEYIVLRGRTAR